MSLKQTDRAESHLLAAWELARPDDLIEGFGEHPRSAGRDAGVPSSTREWPEEFRPDHRHYLPVLLGWRRIHNPKNRRPGGRHLTTDRICGGHAGGPGLDQRGDLQGTWGSPPTRSSAIWRRPKGSCMSIPGRSWESICSSRGATGGVPHGQTVRFAAHCGPGLRRAFQSAVDGLFAGGMPPGRNALRQNVGKK